MKRIVISKSPGWEEWRSEARFALSEGYHPSDIVWQNHEIEEQDLFAIKTEHPSPSNIQLHVPKTFLVMAEQAICHTSPDRFSLLYRLLWRLQHEGRHVLQLKTDDDVLKINAYIKAVRRDAYKIKAFLRFRKIEQTEDEQYVAWYEPEHYSLEFALPFFQARFKNMRWSILTPYRAAYWDGLNLTLHDNPDPAAYPANDAVEQYWLKYYASTFNPARPKKQAMLNQMPKKYWKNMPETVLIKSLLNNSEARARKMIENGQS